MIWNRSETKATALAKAHEGTHCMLPAPSLKLPARTCEAACIMLADDAACDDVVTRLLGYYADEENLRERRDGGLEPLLIINHSTVGGSELRARGRGPVGAAGPGLGRGSGWGRMRLGSRVQRVPSRPRAPLQRSPRPWRRAPAPPLRRCPGAPGLRRAARCGC